MGIIPKYKLNDELWTIDECKAKSFIVKAIVTKTTSEGTTVGYRSSDSVYSEVPEHLCFPSKETLIKQL